jgi:molybdate transport system regulatory protein
VASQRGGAARVRRRTGVTAKHTPGVQFRLRISRGDDIAIGPGKISLLEAIARTGSITAAARALGMSYRRAWLLADTMNRCFTAPLVAAAAGGPGGGGTRLTALGNEVVQTYRRIEATAEAAGAADVAALIRRMR